MARVLVWLVGALVILGSTITGLNLLYPPAMDSASADAPQTADGQSRFNEPGMVYIALRGEFVVKIGGESGPISALDLPVTGGKRIGLDPAVTARIILPDGELSIEGIKRVVFHSKANVLNSIELTYGGTRIANALRQAGFSASDLGIREVEGVRIGARLDSGELHVTVRVIND